MVRRISAFTLGVAFCCAAAVSLSALADPAPEDAKDYRQAIMSAMGGHVSAISMHVRGLVEDKGFLAKHAESLAATASELSRIFPPGSNVGDSDALPAIWDDPEAFAEAVARVEEATAAFNAAAASGDEEAIDATFRDVGAACRGCHDDFRKEHKHNH